MLQEFISSFKFDDQRRNSIQSVASIDSIDLDQRKAWRLVRKELQQCGITPELFDKHKAFISRRLQQAAEDMLGLVPGLNTVEGSMLLHAHYMAGVEVESQSPVTAVEAPDDANAFQDFSGVHPQSSTVRTQSNVISTPIPSPYRHATPETRPAGLESRALAPRLSLPQKIFFTLFPPDSQELFRIVDRCDWEAAAMFLQRGGDLSARNSVGDTILLHLCRTGNKECAPFIRQLLDRGAKIEERRRYSDRSVGGGSQYRGPTPLLSASEVRCIEIVSLLVERGANIEATDPMGCTPLLLAASNRQSETVGYLLQRGAKVNVVSKNGHGALINAVRAKDHETLQLLLDSGAQVDVKDVLGYTPLVHAISTNDVKAAQLLISWKADVNVRGVLAETPLIWAIRHATTSSIVQLLIDHKADLNIQIKSGKTALIAAVYRGVEENIDLLLEHDANVNLRDNSGNTALMLAAYFGSAKTIKLLLQRGADVYAANNNGRTALYYAKERRNIDAIKILEDHIAKNPQ